MENDSRPTKKAKFNSSQPISIQEVSESNLNTFQKILKRNQVRLINSGKTFFVSDSVGFKRTLEKTLKLDSKLRDEFLLGLNELLETKTSLLACLSPTISEETANPSSTIGISSQDSLIKILLGVNELQTLLIPIMLQKIPQYFDDENDNFGDNIPRMILSQFRWLDYIIDSEILTEKLNEMIQLCPPKLKKEIIISIPDIVDDRCHSSIVNSLLELMNQDKQFTVSILDCLSNLNLQPKLLDNVRKTVLQSLDSAPENDLPVLIRFILQSTNSENVNKTIEDLRNHLDVETLSASLNDGIQISDKTNLNLEKKGNEGLILDSLKSGLRFSKEVTNAFLKKIQEIDSPEEHKIIDLWILFVLYSLSNVYKKPVETLFRKKISNKCFTETLLRNSLINHTLALREYFSVLLTLAEIFLRSPENIIRNFGSTLYTLCFKLFEDSYYRQEVLSSIIAHMGSGCIPEIDEALDVLIALVESDTQSVVPFITFIKGILDYIFTLEDNEIRKAFQVFAILSYIKNETSRGFADELHIILHKQLAHSALIYKRIGIIGGVAMIRPLAYSFQHYSENTLDSILAWFNAILNNCRKSYMAMAFFSDEISNLLSTQPLPIEILKIVRDQIDQEWQRTFLITPETLNDKELWMNLDDKEAKVAIRIGELLAQPDSHKRESVSCLASQFKLIQLCERHINSSLTDLKELLGCPILLFNPERIKDFREDDQKESICLTLFYSINWFRELINAFSWLSDDIIVTRKIISRIENMLAIEEHLNFCLSEYSQFTLPFSSVKGPIYPKFPDLKKPKSKKQDSLKKEGSDNSKKDAENSKKQIESKEKKEDDTQRLPYIAALRPYFRELNIETANILSLTFTVDTESQNSETSESVIELDSIILRYILEDLHQKLKMYLVSRKRTMFLPVTSKNFSPNSSFSSPLEALQKIKNIFSALCVHFHRLLNKIQNCEESEKPHIIPCLLMILECFEKVFTFDDLYNAENEALLRDILDQIAANPNLQEKTSSISEFLEACFHLFYQFTKYPFELKVAVALYQVLLAIQARSQSKQLGEILSNLASKYLNQEWISKPKAEQVSVLLTNYIQLASQPLNVLETLIWNYLTPYLKKTEVLPTLNENTLFSFYKVAFCELVRSFAALDVYVDENEVKATLLEIKLAVLLFSGLVEMTKVNTQKQFLAITLKQGKAFAEIFIKRIIGFLGLQFGENEEKVRSIFKEFQRGTRTIQSLCTHVKEEHKELSTSVPPIRKVLETILFKVKGILQEHQRLENWFIGNLKHRNIHGETIKQEENEEEESKPKFKKPNNKSSKKTSKSKSSKEEKTKLKEKKDKKEKKQKKQKKPQKEEEEENEEEKGSEEKMEEEDDDIISKIMQEEEEEKENDKTEEESMDGFPDESEEL